MDTPSSILASVKQTLLEDNAPGAEQWTDVELLVYLNEAGAQIPAFKPAANMVRASVALGAGVSQVLPEGAMELFDIEGNTDGPAVSDVPREALDRGNPAWRTAASATLVEEWSYDKKVPKRFYVNPPNNGTGFVDAVYSAVADEMDLLTDIFTLPQEYVVPAKMWVLARAYQKNAVRGDTAKATDYFNSFTGLLKGRWMSQKENQGGRADGNLGQPA